MDYKEKERVGCYSIKENGSPYPTKSTVFSEHNSSWSEEDKKMLDDIIMCGERHCYLDAGNIAWLKSIKDRVQQNCK